MEAVMNEETWNSAVSSLGISSTVENFEELGMVEIYKVQVHCFDLTRLYNSCQSLSSIEEYTKNQISTDFHLTPGIEKLGKSLQRYSSLLFGSGFIIKVQEFCDTWGKTYILPVKIYYTSEKAADIQNLVLLGIKSRIK